MPGPWLSLVPVTDNPKPPVTPHVHTGPTPSANDVNSTSLIDSFQFPSRSAFPSHEFSPPSSGTTPLPNPSSKAVSKASKHRHDHHPSPLSFLKPMVLHSSQPRRKTSHPTLFPSAFPSLSTSCLKLLENPNEASTNTDHSYSHSGVPRSIDRTAPGFQIRELKVCDVEKVKELHCSSLPVNYPSWFFYDLLRSEQGEGKISLVATLPVNGYFEPICPSHSNQHLTPYNFPTPILSHAQLSHHITSPLSGRKPISLDIIGCITARIEDPIDHPGDDSNQSLYVRILTLCIHSDYRRSGVGKSLLQSMIKKVANLRGEKGMDRPPTGATISENHPPKAEKLKIRLHVQATNRVGFEFYLRQGFKLICFKEGYYSHQLMKPLDPELKKVEHKSDRELEFEKGDAGKEDVKDEDAWFLELDVNQAV